MSRLEFDGTYLGELEIEQVLDLTNIDLAKSILNGYYTYFKWENRSYSIVIQYHFRINAARDASYLDQIKRTFGLRNFGSHYLTLDHKITFSEEQGLIEFVPRKTHYCIFS